jgi:sarcosine oxidase/L-pipecolate oxidase
MGKSVIIVGGGAFGISTAWQTSRQLGPDSKYNCVRVLDRYPPPSRIAAATDLNKIIRTDYSDPVYAALAVTAMQAWTDPSTVFQNHFHSSGWVLSASSSGIPFLDQSAQIAKDKGIDGVKFMTPAEVQSAGPVFTGPMKGWKILSNPAAG